MTICPNCGREIENNTVFCPYCGTGIGNSERTEALRESVPVNRAGVFRETLPTDIPHNNEKEKRRISERAIALIACFVGMGAMLFVGVAFFRYRSMQTERLAAEEKDVRPTESTETVAGDAEQLQVVEVTDSFGLRRGIAERYDGVTDDTRYLSYETDMPLFSFSYPLDVYGYAEINLSENAGQYGENLQQITFQGSSGGTLCYQISSRTERSSLEELTAYVYASETETIQNLENIWGPNVQNGRGFFIVAGVDPMHTEMQIYDMIRITNQYVYQMKVEFMKGRNAEEELRNGYYLEYLYRSCGFSNTTKSLRSYADYLGGIE